MAKESPLAAFHRTHGAQWGESDGWSLPLRFGQPLREYEAVRSRVGLLDLCHRALLRFTGPDRVSYLQGMVSNDVGRLASGDGLAAAVLDIQGKILADVRILCTEDDLLLDFSEPLKEKIVSHLNRYLVADEVEITDLTGQYGIVSLQGPRSRDLLAGLVGTAGLPAGELSHGEFQADGAEVRIVRASHSGDEGFDLLIDAPNLLPVASSLHEKGETVSALWVGSDAQEILRIEAGIPRYGADMDEENILLETGMDHAVSFEKGCYLGQEVIERIHSRGHVNKRLVGLALDGEAIARHGDPINGEQEKIGKVTSSIFSPALKRPVALGYVRRDYTGAGTPVTIQHNGRVIPAAVSDLPFYRPDPTQPA